MEIQIRDCREADLRRVAEIEDLSFDDPYPYRLFVTFLLDFPEGFRVALTEDDMIVGYCILSHLARPKTLMISSIAVHPDFRRHRIGKSLLSDCLTIARKLSDLDSIKMIVLQVALVNTTAQSLYREFGFKYDRKLPDYYGEGRDGILMQLEL